MKNSGFAHLLVVLVVVVGIIIFAGSYLLVGTFNPLDSVRALSQRPYGNDMNINPPTLEPVGQPATDISDTWTTYDSAATDPIINSSFEESAAFAFKYPSSFTRSYGDGVGPMDLAIYGDTLQMDVSIYEKIDNLSAIDYAKNYVDGVYNEPFTGKKLFAAYINCIQPSCKDKNSFSVSEGKVGQSLSAWMAKGPAFDEGSIFKRYFVDFNSKLMVSIYFTYPENSENEKVKDQILSTFKFTTTGYPTPTPPLGLY